MFVYVIEILYLRVNCVLSSLLLIYNETLKMSIENSPVLIPEERIIAKIYQIRSQKVMVDRDLAELYGVGTKVLKQAVRRNLVRFPEDFMFEMTKEELENWRSQNVTSNSDKMVLRYSPMVFSEHGVLMLSSVLNSPKAIQVNIQIMRIFTKIRSIFSDTVSLKLEIETIDVLKDASSTAIPEFDR
jgi:hypothetical protein